MNDPTIMNHLDQLLGLMRMHRESLSAEVTIADNNIKVLEMVQKLYGQAHPQPSASVTRLVPRSALHEIFDGKPD